MDRSNKREIASTNLNCQEHFCPLKFLCMSHRQLWETAVALTELVNIRERTLCCGWKEAI